MKTTFKLSFMMFVEWFIWGAWFVPLWLWLNKSGFSAGEIGWSYACTAIAAILSPILVGSVTDRFFSAQKVLAVLMFAGGVLAGLASGWPLADAVLLGNAVASWVVGHRGGDCAPTREALLLAHKNV